MTPLKNLKILSKWTKTLVLPSLIFVLQATQAHGQIYTIKNGDSILSAAFVTQLCHAARYPKETKTGGPEKLEQLILSASNADFNEENTPSKTFRWHNQFGNQAYCKADDTYPPGNFIRQAILSNYRDFANIIGPKNRLTLNLKLKDPHDHLNIFEFVDKRIAQLEEKHDNRRFEFQQDKEWQNMMFFYFLFSEYKINYDAKLKE